MNWQREEKIIEQCILLTDEIISKQWQRHKLLKKLKSPIMKNRGLSNRFPESVRMEWLYWYACMVCGENRIDALHHIISPSVRFYVKGDHNKSVLNSCPIHNHKCHIGNEAYLHTEENTKMLLQKTLHALTKDLGYTLNERDKEFLTIYSVLYTQNDLEMVK